MTKISSKELGRLRGRLNDQIQFNRELTPAAKNIGYIIGTRLMVANGGKARISNTELMSLAGCDAESTVTRSIQSLREHGHYHIERRVRGDRLFVPMIKEIDVHQCTSKVDAADVHQCTSRPAEETKVDVQECTSSHALAHVATCTPTQEVPAAEGLFKSPSLNPSLYPSKEEAPSVPESPPPSTPKMPTPVVHDVWGIGVNCLAALGVPNSAGRKLIGKWLRDTKDDREAVLNAIRIAFDKETRDPVALITKILQAQGPQPRHGGYEQAGVNPVTRNKVRRRDDNVIDADFAVVGGVQ
jgi:hypothetical protein